MKLVDYVDIADLDCVYLSYDEPNKEENWVKIKNMVPWAVRVDGVKGAARYGKKNHQGRRGELYRYP